MAIILETIGAYFCAIMFYAVTPCVLIASLVWLVITDWKYQTTR